MRRSLFATWSALLLIVPACSADSEAGWRGSVEQLPNGAVKVTNPPDGVWTSADPDWRLIPDVVIGEADGDDAHVFGAISGLEVDESGRIYVLDRQANELRIFAPDGTHIRSVGRSGEGPGEFANANGLVWLTPDTLLVVDQRGNRYSVYSRDGDYIRSVPRHLGYFGWVFSGGYHAGRIYETSSVGLGDDRYPALLGTSIDGARSEAVPMARPEDQAGALMPGAGDTIMLPHPDAPLYESFSIRTDRGGMVIGVPFTARPVYNLQPSGDVWHGHGSSPTVYRTTIAGDTLMEIMLATDAYAVTPAEVSEWESTEAVERFRSMGGKLELERIPTQKPYFDDIMLDPEGHVWLGVPAGANETVFAVIDETGRYLGRLRAEGVLRESFVRPIVRNDRVYWIGRDELDVQRVYAYTIDR
jgi:hypothetical protein